MAKYLVIDVTGDYSETFNTLDEAVTDVMSTLDLEYSWYCEENEGMVPEVTYSPTNTKIWKAAFSTIRKNKGVTRHWYYPGEGLGQTGHSILIERAA